MPDAPTSRALTKGFAIALAAGLALALATGFGGTPAGAVVALLGGALAQPAFALAARLLVEPIHRDATGKAVIDATLLQARALPPAIAAVAVFVAIEIASAGIRRGIVMAIAASLVAIAIVVAAVIGVLQLTGTSLAGLA